MQGYLKTWWIALLLIFNSISFSFLSFLFFFPNNICRGVQNKIRNTCNKKQLFILPFSLHHFSALRQLFLTTDVFRFPSDYISVSKYYAYAAVSWFNKFRLCWLVLKRWKFSLPYPLPLLLPTFTQYIKLVQK